ncbi:MAG: hypothetical protein ACF8Q5_00815 [Phycisphaerales bacterium JB040]
MLSVLTDPNPLLVKSLRARMRWAHVLSWGVVTLTLTLFVSMVIYLPLVYREGVPSGDAAKAVIPAVLIIQAVILMFLGTGSVAYGISMERDEGLVEYQRMTPMSPTAKILGYLFGLPAREYVLVAMTMPILGWAVLESGFSVVTILHFYLIFFSSVWVYHLTALTAGMVSPMPRMTALVSMGLVFVLYFVLPNLSRLGIPFFEHLTIRPILFGLVWEELPEQWRFRAEASGIDRARPIPWFGVSLNQTVYALLAQGFVIGVMYSVLRRRWIRENCHLFSKASGVVAYAGVLVFMLSSLWAIMVQDEVYEAVFAPRFNSAEFVDGQWIRTMRNPNEPVARDAENLMALLFVTIGLMGVMYLCMTTWLTASRHTAVEGWRRAMKLGRERLGWNSDSATSLPACLLMLCLSMAATWLVLDLAASDHGYYERMPTARGMVLPVLAVLGCGLFVQGLCERLGGLVFAVGLFLIWMIPLFVGVILMAAFSQLDLSMLVAMPCPPVPVFSAVAMMLETATPLPGMEPGDFVPDDEFASFRAIATAGGYAYFAAGLGVQVWRHLYRRRVRRIGLGERADRTSWLDADMPEQSEEF